MLAYLAFVACVALLFLGSRGVDRLSVTLVLGMAVVFALPFYFMMRESRSPTPGERALARAWVVFRRVVCFAFAALLATVATAAMGLLFVEGPQWEPLLLAATCLAFAWFALHVGWYGRRNKGAGFARDRADNAYRIRRYRDPDEAAGGDRPDPPPADR